MDSTNLNTAPPNRNASGPLASQPKRSSAPSPRTTVEEADVKSQTRPELKRAVRLREYEGGSSTVEAERRNVLRKEILKIEGEREFENEWLSEPAVRVRDFALCAQEQ
jgi:plasmid stability protein